MYLLEKIYKSANSYKLEALEKCLKFLKSEIEKVDFTQEEKDFIGNGLAQMEEEFPFIKDKLKEIIEKTLDGMQERAVEYSLEGLSSKVGELAEQNQELRSSVSNVSSLCMG